MSWVMMGFIFKRNSEGKIGLTLALTLALLYLRFRLSLNLCMGMGRWNCPAACRRQDRGEHVLVALWHWSLAKCVGSQSRVGLCPQLEPLSERPSKACSHLQE